MSQATPELRDLAERLVAHEAMARKAFGTRDAVSFPAFEKLRPRLATLMGNSGSSALLARAIVRAAREEPSLRGLPISEMGFLPGAKDAAPPVDVETTVEAGVVVLTQLLEMLVAFIGANLTLGMLRDTWPKLPLTDFYLENGDGK